MNQEDTDSDSLGDACDECTDTDQDGYGNPEYLVNTCPDDNCPDDSNASQEDGDSDGEGTACDNCTDDSNASQEDGDFDGIGTVCDNCPDDSNPNQEDFYPPSGNGIGDVCECEGNFNCSTDQDVDGSDAALFKGDFGRGGFNFPCIAGDTCNGDFACDGDVDGSDAALFKADFGRSTFSNLCPGCATGGEWCQYQ